MTIILEPEIEEAIAEKARQAGTSPEQLAAEGLRTLFAPAIRNAILLKEHGIGPEQAAELRASLAPFAAGWELPEMEAYDDYDAAKERLEAR